MCFQSSCHAEAFLVPGNTSDIEDTPQEPATLNSLLQNLSNTSANTVSAFQAAAQVAKACVVPDNAGLITNTGWRYDPTAGYYTGPNDTRYLLRARKTLSYLDNQFHFCTKTNMSVLFIQN